MKRVALLVLLAAAAETACTSILGDDYFVAASSAGGGDGAGAHGVGSQSGPGGATGGDGGIAGGAAGGPVCDDPGPEPNETEEDAFVNENAISCFPIESFTQSGLVAGVEDVDFFRFPMTDVCSSDTTRPTLKVKQGAAGTRFCMFPECATTQTPDVLECELGAPATSPNGVDGCCATGANVRLHLVCTMGAGTLTTMFVRVNRPSPDECHAYTFELTHTTP